MSLLSNSVQTAIRKASVMDSQDIYIQANFWRKEGRSLVRQKGSTDEVAHILGSYEGPLPPNDELEKLFVKEGDIGDIKQIIKENIPILYGEGPEEGLFPIIKGSTLSFFISQMEYEKIEECFNENHCNAVTFRLKVPQVCPYLIGHTRGEDTRPIFSVRINTSLFENGIDVDVWNANVSTIPVFIPSPYENHPMIEFQKKAKALAAEAAAKQSRLRNADEVNKNTSRNGGLIIPSSLVEPIDPVKAALSR